MRVRWRLGLAVWVLAACVPAASAQDDLKKNLKDNNVAEHWIYDDIAAGFAAARASSKPLLVTFRCVP